MPPLPVPGSYRDERGLLHRVELTVLGNLPRPGSPLPARLVIDRGSRPLVQRWIPAALGELGDEAFARLDAEISALTRLRRVFAGRYPPELPELVGYDVSAAEPFVLLDVWRGDAAARFAGRLTLPERYAFQRGLARALQHTAAADLVHGEVGLPNLRWDGHTVQLIDFGQARRAGEPHGAEVRADIRGAGVALRELLFGRQPSGHPLDHAGDPPALRALIGNASADPAAGQPLAQELAQRLRSDERVVRDPDLDELAEPGRTRFGEAAAAKLAAAVPATPATTGWAGLPFRLRRRSRPVRTAPPQPAEQTGLHDGTGKIIRCPVCLDEFVWSEPEWLSMPRAEHPEPDEVEIVDLDPEQRPGALRTGYVRCPNPRADRDEHYLSAGYGDYRRPIVIAVAGLSAAARAELVRTMTELVLGGSTLAGYGLAATRLGGDLPPWSPGYARTLLLTRHDGMLRPLTFVEVAGSDRTEPIPADSPEGRVLRHADAILVGHRPWFLGEDGTMSRPDAGAARAAAFLREHPADPGRPAAIVLSGADGLRYVPPIDRWLRRSWIGRPLDPAVIRAESRDVFAYLDHQGDAGPLELYRDLARCTLHVTPAAPLPRPGREPAPIGGRPRKLAEPVVAILAMAGVIDSPEAGAVGAPGE